MPGDGEPGSKRKQGFFRVPIIGGVLRGAGRLIELMLIRGLGYLVQEKLL